jgi:hypothetical protein
LVKVKKYKLLIAAAAVAVGVAGAGLLPNAVTAKAGSSEVYIASSTSIDDTSINSGDFLTTGKVAAENGKAKFNTLSEKEKLTTKTKAFNLKEYGVTTLLDFSSTLNFSSFAEDGNFSMAFGLNNLKNETGAEDSFAVKVNYDSASKKFSIGVSEYTKDGEISVYASTVIGAIKINRDVTFKVFVDTDCNLTVSVLPTGASSETKLVSGYGLNVNPEGYISYISSGRNEITLSDPQILVYEYDAPETIDYTETFDKNGYNSNVFYSASTASPITPSSLSVENGALRFKNTAAAYISTRYKYSNFELSFDITDMARTATFDDNGNVVSLINSWFGIAFGVNSIDEAPDTTTRYSTWLQLGRVVPGVENFVKPANVHYLLWDNNGNWNNVTDPQYMTDFNPWSTKYDGEVINVKFAVTDGLVELFMKIDGDPDWGEPYFTYDFGKVKTGYVRIFTAGNTGIETKGIEYNDVGNFTIDNLSIKDTDHENAKTLLPTPEYKSNLWGKTPDYDYKTKPDDKDLIGNKISSGDMNGSSAKSGCASSVGLSLPLIALAAIPFIKRKKK